MNLKRFLTFTAFVLSLVLLLAAPALATESDLAASDPKPAKDSAETQETAGTKAETARVCDPEEDGEAAFNTLEDFYGLADAQRYASSAGPRKSPRSRASAGNVEWRTVTEQKPAEKLTR